MTDREPSPSGSEASEDSAVDLSESKASDGLEACDDLFDGIVIALSGKIPDRNHEQIMRMARASGICCVKMEMRSVTHLITTPETYESQKRPIKLTQAMKNPDCEIVSIDWLLASIKAGKPVDVAKYLIVGRTKRSASATSDSNAQPGAKRKATSDPVDSGNESTSTDKAKENMLINFSKLSAMVDKASHNQKDRRKLAVYQDDNGVIWDATLVEDQSALSTLPKGQNIAQQGARIIRIQLIANPSEGTYYTFIRQTSLYRKLDRNRKGDGRLDFAIPEFETTFKQFTGLAWSRRNDSPKDKKAIYVPFKEKTDQSHGELPQAVCEILKRLMDAEHLPQIEKALLEPQDSPLLQKRATSAEHSLQAAVALLGRISDVANAAILSKRLKQCFLSLFCGGGIYLPRGDAWIDEACRSIEGLRDFRAVEDKLKRFGRPTTSSLRQIYGLLHLAKLSEVKKDTSEHKALMEYFDQSYGNNQGDPATILNIFQIERQGEPQRFSQWREDHKSSLSERRLLWHGAKITEFPGILRNGIRHSPRPGAAPGILCSDMSGRSVRGCRTVSGKYGFVLLCEVELGKTSQRSSNSINGAVHGDCCIKEIPNGVSHMPWCDATFTDTSLKGVKIPGGRPGQTTDTTEPSKEYLIMEPGQICQRYLFHFKVY